MGERPRARILLEASTESEWVARCLERLGHEVIIADPNFAPMYAARSRKIKTDRRDARALAEACRLGAYRPAHRLSDAQTIEIHVDSPEGTLEAAFVLIDTLGMIRAPVRALGRGLVGTPAIGVVAAAGYRAASQRARFRLAQPTLRFVGTPDEVDAARRWHRDLLVRFQTHLARITGRPVDAIADDMRAGRTLDAAEARAYGLIDAISAASR